MALAKVIHQRTDLFGPVLLFQLITKSRPPSLGQISSSVVLMIDFLTLLENGIRVIEQVHFHCFYCQELQKCFT